VGGKARRFGKDKTALFYRLLYRRCKKLFFPVKLVAKRKKYPHYPFFIEKSSNFAPIFPLMELLGKYPILFILSGDTPFISPLQLGKLKKARRVARGNPLVGVYIRRRDWHKLKRRLQTDYRLQKVAPTSPLPFPQLENINTFSQWRRWKESLPPYYQIIAKLK
jgi:molybdopterin-guanine dinucleotide biosynthesis protein A